MTPLIVNSRVMVSACRRDRQQGDPPLSQRPSSGKTTCDAERAQGLRKGNPPSITVSTDFAMSFFIVLARLVEIWPERAGRAAVPAPALSLRRFERSPAPQPTFPSGI